MKHMIRLLKKIFRIIFIIVPIGLGAVLIQVATTIRFGDPVSLSLNQRLGYGLTGLMLFCIGFAIAIFTDRD